jgi:hypothetical protein
MSDDAFTVDDLSGVLSEGMPDVESYIDGPNDNDGSPEPPKSVEPTGEKDTKGIVFDPSIHRTGADGTPLTNKDGTWAKKPGMGARKSRVVVPGADNSQEIQTTLAMVDGAYSSALATVATFYGIGQMIDSEEWAPLVLKNDAGAIVYDEEKQLTAAFHEYYKLKGVDNIPPELVIAMPVIAAIAIRSRKPKTGAIVKKMASDVWRFIKGLWGKKLQKRND